MPYRPLANSTPWQAITLLRAEQSVTVEEMAVALRVRREELKHRLAHAIAAGYVSLHEGVYSIGLSAPEGPGLTRSVRGPSRGQREPKGVQYDPAAARRHRGSLRELMDLGGSIEVGSPLRELADLHEAARRVIAAKATSRFRGAEVDVAVARELRCISQAMAQATANLNRYLEVMES